MNNLSHLITTAAGLSLAIFIPVGAPASPVTLFSDSFESGSLSRWTGITSDAHHGVIVQDPLNAGNRVLSFTALTTGGDIWSKPIVIFGQPNPQGWRLSFDFLGLAQGGVQPPEFGGMVGVMYPPGTGAWVAGTYPPAVNGVGSPQVQLIPDGAWHHYDMDITPVILPDTANTFRLTLEDWSDRGGVRGMSISTISRSRLLP